MAVSNMKKLSVVVLREDADSLLYALQRLRCVELTATDAEPLPDATNSEEIVSAISTDKTKLAEAQSKAQEAIGFLSGYRVKARGLFVSPVEVEWDESWPEGEALVEKSVALSQEMERLRGECIRIAHKREGLLPWQSYTGALPEEKTQTTRTVCGLLPGTLPPTALDEALADYACVTTLVSGADAKEKSRSQALSVTMWHEEYDDVMRALHGLGFTVVPYTVTTEDGGVAGVLRALAHEEQVAKETLTGLRKQAEELAEGLPLVEEYFDKLTTIEARTDAAQSLGFTTHTAVLTGWVPENQVDAVVQLLEERGDAYQWSDPTSEDDAPVLMINNAMASQFEPVVSLYSLPAYGSFDPTFIMSFFYILIFGLMFADVGYGVLLMLGCILGKKLLKPEGSLGKFLSMFAMCGGSMIVMGVLFGGYFGDLPQAIAQNFGGRTSELDLSLWFNPLNDPMMFLVISIVIGAIHLFAGLAVQFYVLWKGGDKVSAICDAGSWMLIFIGAGVSFLALYVGLALVVLGLVMILCTAGRHEKNPIMKFVKGLLGLYGIVNYISDLLSYSRILSLGLASAVIASVFNIIGTMAGPTVIGVLLLIVVGTIGHAMNLSINLLGSFVHTSRLQYIEFFGKFYEDGGRPFTPLTPRSKYVKFR